MGIFWLGLVLLRPFARKLLPPEPGVNGTLTMYLQYFGIIYGLLLGLLAVGAYQNHAETRRSVVGEAASLAALYRDVSGYPEPYRTDLKTLVREYTCSTIEDAWPKQRRGMMPELDGPSPVAGIHARMVQSSPSLADRRQFPKRRSNSSTRYRSAAQTSLQRHLGHAPCHVVHGRARRAGQHDLPLAVRSAG